MEILGVIPARGGSKGIPRKNLALLGGRPLLAHTCDAARASAALTRVVVSTDDEEVAATARTLGIEVPFLRPAALAGDDAPMLDVLLDLLATLDRRESYRPQAVALLQPTSPFRRAEHVDAAVDLLIASGADSVVSVVDVPNHFNPVSVMRLDAGRLRPFLDEPSVTRRQDKPRVLARNGPAVLAVRTATVDGVSLYGDDCRPLFMEPEESLDIDTPWDFAFA